MTRSSFLHSMAITALLVGCGGGEGSTAGTSSSSGAGGAGTADAASSSASGSSVSSSGSGAATEDLNMTEADFECVLNWTAANRFRITNKLNHLDEAIAVANAADGGTFPVGTVIQLVPTEAMVKRRAGFSAETKDWEFFFLEITGTQTTIKARGTADVINGFGGNCLNCHAKAMPQWDLICGETHGCDPIPVTADQIKMAQDGDTRCKP